MGFSLRRTARDVQDFLPETGLKSCELALLVHANCFLNYQCRYHERSKNRTKYDGHEVSGYKLHGVAYQMKLGHSTSNRVMAKHGFMHCGCYIEDVLLDFFFWKSWMIHSRNPDVDIMSKTMMDDWLPPRLRAFVIQSFLATSHLTLDDLYAFDYGTVDYYQRVLLIQGRRVLKAMINKRVPPPLVQHLPNLPFDIRIAATTATPDMLADLAQAKRSGKSRAAFEEDPGPEDEEDDDEEDEEDDYY